MRSAPAALAALLFATMASAGEGVLEINQTCAVQLGCFPGDDPGFPVTVVSPGGYMLTSNLDKAAVGVATIEIESSSASLDLNGFTITGFAPVVRAPTAVVTLHDGFIEATGANIGTAIELGGVSTIRNIRVSSSYYPIVMGAGCRVVSTTVLSAYYGIVGGADCHVSDSVIGGGGHGFASLQVGDESVIEGNRVWTNDGAAIVAGVRSRISGNATRGTHGVSLSGISAGSHSVIVNNVASHHKTTGIVCGDACVVVGNTANDNHNGGILCGRGCQILNNTAIENGDPSYNPSGPGIRCGGVCSVLGNTVVDNLGFGLVDEEGGSAYSANLFSNNNGGDANPQIFGAIEMGTNVCGGDTTCP